MQSGIRYVWAVSNFLCGKRLEEFLPELVKSLKRHKEIKAGKDDEALLCAPQRLQYRQASRTRQERAGHQGTCHHKARHTSQAPDTNPHIRRGGTTTAPAFLKWILLLTAGRATRGEYVNTLNMTDIATGWTVCTAFMGRSERFRVAAIEEVRPSLPFPILGIDSDNGGDVINAHLMRYCERNSISFTRSRPWKKNDSAHIEQKNWDVVRKMIGYGRFETREQLEILNRIHRLLSFYQNYFQPFRKLLSKKRIGAKVTKKYDTAATPVERLLARKDTPKDTKNRLRDTFLHINPAAMPRSVNDLTSELYDTLLE